MSGLLLLVSMWIAFIHLVEADNHPLVLFLRAGSLNGVDPFLQLCNSSNFRFQTY